MVTLDVIMPKIDGWSVLTALKADPDLCDIPVVMLGSDQDGLHRVPAADVRAHEAALRISGVYYRDDETLADDGPALLRAVAPSWRRLRRALALGQARHLAG